MFRGSRIYVLWFLFAGAPIAVGLAVFFGYPWIRAEYWARRMRSEEAAVRLEAAENLAGLGRLGRERLRREIRRAIRDEMVKVPAGTFRMGSTPEEIAAAERMSPDNASLFAAEAPAREVRLSAFRIARHEVTEEQFYCFRLAMRAAGRRSDGGSIAETTGGPTGDEPAVTLARPAAEKLRCAAYGVSWKEADEFCRWLELRLPTEAEWERAARGTDGRVWPWGNSWDGSKAVIGQFGSGPSPVGSLPEGASPCGLLDAGGNVWEWCSDFYDPDIGRNGARENPTGPAKDLGCGHVLKSGSWLARDYSTRCAFRVWINPPGWNVISQGFRCAE